MAPTEPGVQEIEHAIAELLREEEIGALSTIAENGYPHTATMHFAADGLSVYFHTFKYTRKFAHLQRDPRVGYTLAHLPPEGFYGRMKTRAIQVQGRATIVTDQAEIDRAVEVSRQQFDWLKDTAMYDVFNNPPHPSMRNVFFRVDPEIALWQDNRVRMLWRKLVTFAPDGSAVERVEDYDTSGRGDELAAQMG